jgi:hypothetical protein
MNSVAWFSAAVERVTKWNYDRYLVQNETIVTRTEAEFFRALTRWL